MGLWHPHQPLARPGSQALANGNTGADKRLDVEWLNAICINSSGGRFASSCVSPSSCRSIKGLACHAGIFPGKRGLGNGSAVDARVGAHESALRFV